MPLETACKDCGYDYHTLPDLEKHKAGDDCAVNLRLRMSTLPEHLVPIGRDMVTWSQRAGLEVWRDGDPLQPAQQLYVPRWAYWVIRSQWLQGHRVWILRKLARDPDKQTALNLCSQATATQLLEQMVFEASLGTKRS